MNIETCQLCSGTGILYLKPEKAGYVYLYDRVWRKPDGTLYEFSPNTGVGQMIAVPCGSCMNRGIKHEEAGDH